MLIFVHQRAHLTAIKYFSSKISSFFTLTGILSIIKIRFLKFKNDLHSQQSPGLTNIVSYNSTAVCQCCLAWAINSLFTNYISTSRRYVFFVMIQCKNDLIVQRNSAEHPGAFTWTNFNVPHLQFQSLKISHSRCNLLNVITHLEFGFHVFTFLCKNTSSN